jgi:hypothetical protein
MNECFTLQALPDQWIMVEAECESKQNIHLNANVLLFLSLKNIFSIKWLV